ETEARKAARLSELRGLKGTRLAAVRLRLLSLFRRPWRLIVVLAQKRVQGVPCLLPLLRAPRRLAILVLSGIDHSSSPFLVLGISRRHEYSFHRLPVKTAKGPVQPRRPPFEWDTGTRLDSREGAPL